jgi:hypothetical protein
MAKREEHCAFPVLDKNGKCIARCSRNNYHEDCIGNKHESITEYQARVEAERKVQ